MAIIYQHKTNPYATHQPVLYECIKRSVAPGHIVELGCGDGSTHLINEVCKELGKNAISIETDEKWFMKFTNFIEDHHRFFLLKHWSEIISKLNELEIAVLFVDQGNWESRLDTIIRFNDIPLVILHDSDYFPREFPGFSFDKHYKYVRTYMPLRPHPYHTGPPTTLLSNSIDITKEDWNINYENYN